MIVLTSDQKDFFVDFKIAYQTILNDRGVDINPIEIKNNLWMLPEDVLTDERYVEMRLELEKRGAFSEIVLRNVSDSEIIEYEL